MIKEIVGVVRVDGNKVTVRFERKAACSCCKTAYLCSGTGDRIAVLDSSELELKAGDKIEAGFEEKKSFLASCLTFLFPAVIFLVVSVGLRHMPELLSFFLAILAIFLYYCCLKVFLRRNHYFDITVIRKI